MRAAERGYFGNVAQARPSSPAPSYKLAPDAKLVDWGQVNKLRSDSSSVASSSFDVFQDRNSSTTSLPATSTIRKPSPLRLQPSGAELNGKKNHNMSSVGGVGGNFLPPVPSPRSIRAPSPRFNEEKGSNWVSPLDVHFSRPTTPAGSTSFLPKLAFPLDFGNSELSLPLPDFNGPKSETASIVNTVVTMPPPIAQQGRPRTPKEIYAEFSKHGFANSPTLSTFSGQETLVKSPTFSTFSTFSKEEAPKAKSPTFSVFPQQAQPVQHAPPRPNRLSMKSMFSTEDAPVRSSKEDFSRTFQLPPVPLDDLAPRLPTINPDRFPQDPKVWTPTSPIRDSILNRQRQPVSAGARQSQQWSLPSPTLPDSMIDAQWQPSSNAIVRASIVSKQRVSVVRGPGAQSQDLDVQFAKMRGRGHSMAASSMYSTRTSILEPEDNATRHIRTRSQSSDARRSIRNRSNSSHKRTSSRSLSRTRDSIRESRKTSSGSFRSGNSHRRSRDRDQLHFDPTAHRRNRSGSVQGRAVNFDQPRESPFSNLNHTSDHSHSPSSSVSSSLSSGSLSRFETNSPQKPILAHDYSSALLPPVPARFQPQDPERLSIAPQVRGRPASEASQNSIGEFYDSYYRQSTMVSSGQPTAIPMGPGFRISVQDETQAFEDRARGRSGSIGARRLAPLKFGTGAGGGYGPELGVSGYGGFAPIVEVASPMPSPLVMGRDVSRERFPQMI